MEPDVSKRKLAAILAADVVGYSRLMEGDETGTLRELNKRVAVFQRLVPGHDGRIFGGAGDSVLAEFPSAVQALNCAIKIQDEMGAGGMQFRIGISLGDVIIEGDNLMGQGVNIAARIESLAEPGGISISEDVFRQVRNKVQAEYHDAGMQNLKNIAEPVRVYSVTIGGSAPRGTEKTGHHIRKRGVLALVAGIVMVAAVFGYWQTRTPETTPAQEQAQPAPSPPNWAGRPALVVLPFSNLSNDPEQEYFSDGITDDLIIDLSSHSGLYVITRRTAFLYKKRAVDIETVARELGVSYVVEGSIRHDKDTIRVNVQLVDASSGANLWAHRFEKGTQDIFRVQDEMRENIYNALSLTLSEEQQRRGRRRETNSFAAYDYFLRGQASLVRRASATDNDRAREYMEQAIAVDPNFARAHAALALTYADAFRFDWSDDPKRTADLAVEIGEQAVRIDDQSPQAHWILGYIYLFVLEDHARAIKMAERAISLAPNDSDGYTLLAVINAFGGKPSRTKQVIEQLVRTYPHYPSQVPSVLGLAYLLLGDYSASLTAYEESLLKNPSRVQGNVYKAIVLYRLGRLEDAEWQVDQLFSLHPDFDVQVWAARQPFRDKTITQQLVADLRKLGVE